MKFGMTGEDAIVELFVRDSSGGQTHEVGNRLWGVVFEKPSLDGSQTCLNFNVEVAISGDVMAVDQITVTWICLLQ